MKISYANVVKINYQIEDRYIEILSICRLSKKDFCGLFNIIPQNFCRYVKNTKIELKDVEIIENLGINSRWLMTGLGIKYNNSDNGLKIQELIEKYKVSDDNYYCNRLRRWIETHYESIENFEKEFEIEKYKYFLNLNYRYQISYELSRILMNEGFNLKWLFHLDESPYLTSEKGREKKKWLVKSCGNKKLII